MPTNTSGINMQRQHPLTSCELTLDNGRIAHYYNFHEWRIRVMDDAENALLLIELFKDDLFTPFEKLNILLEMLFPDPEAVCEAVGDDLEELLAGVLWEVCGLDVTHTHKSEYGGEPCFDWEQDAGRIRATLLSVYGIEWDKVKNKLTYSQVCELLEMAPHESPFGQAVYYRTASEPKSTAYNREEVENFRKARQFYALNTEPSVNHMEKENSSSNDIYAALKRWASDG